MLRCLLQQAEEEAKRKMEKEKEEMEKEKSKPSAPIRTVIGVDCGCIDVATCTV